MSGRKRLLTLTVSGLFLFAAKGTTFGGRIITVDDDGPAHFNNIQAAIDTALDGDIVVLKDGLYRGDGNREISLYKGITLRSENGPDECVIDCEGSEGDPHRAFMVGSREPATIIEGLTISGGYMSEGGAVHCSTGTPKIVNCRFVGNSAANGGAIFCQRQGRPEFRSCVFKQNTAELGGAFYCHAGGSATFNSCLFVENSAQRYGGGLYVNKSGLVLVNCTVPRNYAKYLGGGLDSSVDSTVTVKNSVFWENRTDQGYQQISCSHRVTLWVDYSTIQGGTSQIYSWLSTLNWGIGNFTANPGFTADGYHLRSGSPCRDSGDPLGDYGGLKDIDGQSRLMAGRVDVGADEFATSAILRVWPQEIVFSTLLDGPPPAGAVLQIKNAGIGVMSWTVAAACPWLSISATEGQCGTEWDEVVLDADTSGLETGSYECELSVSAIDALDGLQTVRVTLNIEMPVVRVPHDARTIQAAIDAVHEGGTVIVADGVYTGLGNRDIDFKGKRITVRSESGPENCIVDCNCAWEETIEDFHSGFLFRSIEKSDSVLEGFTITGGLALEGGGIYCEGSSPTIRQCIIVGNIALNHGAGMSSQRGSPTITDCIVTDNKGIESVYIASGGGIYCRYGSPTISDCTIARNSGLDGGGIYCDDNTATITDCTFHENSAFSFGGGLYVYGGQPTVRGCTFNGNMANFGGGIEMERGQVTVSDCVIANNSAEQAGGGMYCRGYKSELTLRRSRICNNSAKVAGGFYGSLTIGEISDCVLSGNSAAEAGGAVLNVDILTLLNCTLTGNSAASGSAIYTESTAPYPVLSNCILWDNSSGQIGQNYYAAPLIRHTDIAGGWPGEGNIDTDPCFVDPGYWDANGTPDDRTDDFWVDGDYHLLPDSPCINAGDPSFVAEPNDVDMDGEARVMLGRVDMGADEFNPFAAEFVVVRKERIERTVFEYECEVMLENISRFAVKNVSLEMAKVSANMTIIDSELSFSDAEIGAGASARSVDTCTFTVDRAEAIDPAGIVWRVTAELADTGAKVEHTLASIPPVGPPETGFEYLAGLAEQWLWIGTPGGIEQDTIPDGTINLADFAEFAAKWGSEE